MTRAEVHRTGTLEGPIRARRLAVRLGGIVNGPCLVGENAVPEVPEGKLDLVVADGGSWSG